ncbi:DMT family transporter [Deinococcus lacus]
MGVGLISVSGGEHLDALGVAYALGFAGANALGTTLFGRWGPPPESTPLEQMAWELTLGGLMLLPVAWSGLPALEGVDTGGWAALAFMSLVGTALAAIVWQRGLNILPVQQVSLLAPLSPLTAVLLDIAFVGRVLSPLQWLGAALVLGSVLLSSRK